MASKYDVSCNFVSVRESVSNYSNHGWVDGDAINGDKIVRKWKGEDRGTCRGKSPHLLETRWNITRDRAFNPLNYSEGHTKIFDPCTCDSSSFQIFFNFSNASILLSFSFLIFISNRFSLSLSLIGKGKKGTRAFPLLMRHSLFTVRPIFQQDDTWCLHTRYVNENLLPFR